ncbi:hypothetical protein [Neorhodopirellula lusitana]|nr:hypothetical protein [Neorhodopirellula lusitana]
MIDPTPYASPREAMPEILGTNRVAPRSVLVVCRILSIASLMFGALFVGWAFSLSSGFSTFAVVVLGLICSPYILLWFACRWLTTCSGAIVIALTLAGFVWFGVDAFLAVDDDAQGGLILLFAPLVQLAAGVAAMCVAVIVDFVERKLLANQPRRKRGEG